MALRTTVLTGFPGETEASFSELLEFVREFRFDRLGVFPYSHEEGTPAYNKFPDIIPDRIKSRRADKIMELQQEISLQLNEEKVGKIFKVLIDRREEDYFVGRTQYDSPDVDNEVLIPLDRDISTGQFYQVKITGAGEFDLYGTLE